ncbi:hypothetical protein D3C75_1366410 [compost metagenome]
MVFCLANDNFIARLQVWTGIALGHHIDGFGGASRPDNIFAAFGIEEAGNLIARGFIARG